MACFNMALEQPIYRRDTSRITCFIVNLQQHTHPRTHFGNSKQPNHRREHLGNHVFHCNFAVQHSCRRDTLGIIWFTVNLKLPNHPRGHLGNHNFIVNLKQRNHPRGHLGNMCFIVNLKQPNHRKGHLGNHMFCKFEAAQPSKGTLPESCVLF